MESMRVFLSLSLTGDYGIDESGLTEESGHTAVKSASTNAVLVACSPLYLSASLITGHFNRSHASFFLFRFCFSFFISIATKAKTKQKEREREIRASVQSIWLPNVKWLIQVPDQISYSSDTSSRAQIPTTLPVFEALI